jgi:hypothetical protein
MREYIGVSEFAKIVHADRGTIIRAIREGTLAAFKIREFSPWQIPIAALEYFEKQRRDTTKVELC